jgi:glutamate transport system substrate-binding protein
MRVRALVTAAICVVLGLSLAACGSSRSGPGKKRLVVGITFDQPGLGMRNPDGSVTGFDVDVARYVGRQLGYEADQVVFTEVKSTDPEADLATNVVDMVLATYSITAARRQKVDFAGPYFLAHQDLLVRADNRSIVGPQSLSGVTLCSVRGSSSSQRVKDYFARKVRLQEYPILSRCIPALLSGAVDAVTADDTVLDGYAAQHPGRLRVVGKGFSDENYGIDVKNGSPLRPKINAAISKMENSGAWKTALMQDLKLTDSQVPTPPALLP